MTKRLKKPNNQRRAMADMSMLSEPWCLSEMNVIALAQSVTNILTATDIIDMEMNLNHEVMRIEDGIAHIFMDGVMVNKAPQWMQMYMGACGTDDIMRAVAQAGSDPEVTGILMHIDSPGGMAQGTPELAQAILATGKPAAAFTDGCCASGAYWVAAACQVIVATPSATVGSIGCYVPVVSYEQFYANIGVNVDVIRSGQFKGAGVMGTKMSPEQRTMVQNRVDHIYSEFSGFVSARRGIAAEHMQGQDFWGQQGQDAGLVDDIGSMEHAEATLRAIAALDKPPVS